MEAYRLGNCLNLLTLEEIVLLILQIKSMSVLKEGCINEQLERPVGGYILSIFV